MSVYCSALGEKRDGVCGCGQPATAVVQIGWHNGLHGARSGPQLEEVCDECYADFVREGYGEIKPCPYYVSSDTQPSRSRAVCGSYDGAIPWEIYDDSPAEDLARRLCASAGCQGYCVDGEWFYAS